MIYRKIEVSALRVIRRATKNSSDEDGSVKNDTVARSTDDSAIEKDGW